MGTSKITTVNKKEQNNKISLKYSPQQIKRLVILYLTPNRGNQVFGLQLSSSSQTTVTPTPIEGKLAPGVHTPVPEKEMVNNLIQRF